MKLIPRPAEMEVFPGFFIPEDPAISVDSLVTGRLDAERMEQLGLEGYELSVDRSSIRLVAASEAGLFYGRRTLEQLRTDAGIPCVRIMDRPRFAYRGVHLDVSRHFFPKKHILKMLDEMARYKFNVFHFHLTDNGGWRIRIDKYPRLTSEGAYRTQRDWYAWWDRNDRRYLPEGTPGAYGGYYSKEETTIYIRPGTYREKVTVPANRQKIRMVGDDALTTVITWDDYALKPDSHGNPMGTSATSTVFIYGDDFLAENITFENSAGEGREIAQACAITVDADRAAFLGCRFIANQDTIYTYGKGQHQYFGNCWIEGTTDFIFGASTVWFENCTILSKKDSYVTAASTPGDEDFGYVFRDCDLVAADGVTEVYLGRPWRPYARTVFVGCRMGAHIRPEGWHDWGKEYAHGTTYYAEYGSTGPGAEQAERVDWSHRLEEKDLDEYVPERVLDAGTEIDRNGVAVPVKWFFADRIFK